MMVADSTEAFDELAVRGNQTVQIQENIISIHILPGFLAQQFLGLWIVDQDLVQVFFVQDE